MSARPVRPFPSAKGWMVSNWAWAMAACTRGGRVSDSMNAERSSIRGPTAAGGGGTKSAPQGLKSLPPIQFCAVRTRPAIGDPGPSP